MWTDYDAQQVISALRQLWPESEDLTGEQAELWMRELSRIAPKLVLEAIERVAIEWERKARPPLPVFVKAAKRLKAENERRGPHRPCAWCEGHNSIPVILYLIHDAQQFAESDIRRTKRGFVVVPDLAESLELAPTERRLSCGHCSYRGTTVAEFDRMAGREFLRFGHPPAVWEDIYLACLIENPPLIPWMSWREFRERAVKGEFEVDGRAMKYFEDKYARTLRSRKPARSGR